MKRLLALPAIAAAVVALSGCWLTYGGLTSRTEIGCQQRLGTPVAYPYTADPSDWTCSGIRADYNTCVTGAIASDPRFAGYVHDACWQGDGVLWRSDALGYIG